MSYRVVHYINQFFANIGGEEMAHIAPEIREGFVGPGMAFNQAWKGEAEIVKTIICGDSYYAEHEKDAKAQILDREGNPIPNLYSSGEFGSVWCNMYQGGGNLSECVNFSRIAVDTILGK